MGSRTLGQNKMLVIVDYGMGNMHSVAKAFELLGASVLVSSKAEDIKSADRLVLPGVGAFADGMRHLREFGLIEILATEVIENKKPILGICLGMQLLARDSEEFGFHKGLGWINASVKRFSPKDKDIKIPHVGWNNIIIKNESCPLFKGIKKDSTFYFVHSYYMVCDSDDIAAATCNYGEEFTAAIQKNNIFATQFHPEKSQTVGLKILENFINWKN